VRRFSLASLVAALSLAASASPATASVTIGQIGNPGGCVAGFDDIQLSVPSGNSYVVPGNGKITSWRTYAGPGGGQMTMKIFRKVLDPYLYMVVGHSGPRTLLPGQLSGNTFPADVPVKPGDLLGMGTPAGSPVSCLIDGGGGEYLYRDNGPQPGGLGDGQDGTFSLENGVRFNIEAVFEPTNSFEQTGHKRNAKKGTATLTFNLSNPGDLSASGKGVTSAGAAVISKPVSAPGDVQLLIRAKGKKKRKLNETGKVKLNVAITYTPTGGSPNTQSVKVKLKKKV
jgi:hypothetical protein